MSLTPAERDTMAERLRALTQPVRLAVYTRAEGCDTCADTRAIVDAVVALSPHLSVEAHELAAGAMPPGVEHVPAIVVLGEVEGAFVDHGVRLVGAPIGHELTALADAILAVGGAAATLTADSQVRLAALETPVHIQVFSTPTCVYCPRAVALAHRLALASPLVSATAYSVIEFPDLIRRHRVTGVPKIVVGPHGAELLGAQPEAALVDAVVGHARS
jgi:glutaredoxin-like protein